MSIKHPNSKTGRMDGGWAMKQIYDDLGIFKPIEWHARGDDENVAHNWNDGDSIKKIFYKLTEGSGEWDTSIKKALESGRLTQDRLDAVISHYKGKGHSTKSLGDSLGGIPNAPGKAEGQQGRAYGEDWWDARKRYETVTDHPYQHPRTDAVTLDLKDSLAFESMTYAAPGRQGKYKSGDDKKKLHPSLGTDKGAQAAYDLETRFIDELYGTEKRVYDGLTEEETIKKANETLETKIDKGEVDDQWGLDLRRTSFPEGAKKGNQAWYEHITRGEVDWAYYQNDSAYQAAYQTLKDSGKFDDVFDKQDNITSAAEIRLINEQTEGLYQDKLIEGQGKDAWRYDWDGKYEPADAPDPWVPKELTVYKPGSGDTVYNTVDQRKVTAINTFQEAIFEPTRPNINIPRVAIDIPDILGGNPVSVPPLPGPVPLTQETQQNVPSTSEAE